MVWLSILKDRESVTDCSLGCGIVLAILIVSILVKGVIIQVAWNWGVVEILELTTHTIEFWQACVVGFFISLITG